MGEVRVSESWRDRVAPWVPYWPWAVIPALALVIAVLGAQLGAVSRRLDLTKDDVVALQHEVDTLKRARSLGPSPLAALTTPRPHRDPEARAARTDRPERPARAERSEPRPRSGAKGKKARRSAPPDAPAAP